MVFGVQGFMRKTDSQFWADHKQQILSIFDHELFLN